MTRAPPRPPSAPPVLIPQPPAAPKPDEFVPADAEDDDDASTVLAGTSVVSRLGPYSDPRPPPSAAGLSVSSSQQHRFDQAILGSEFTMPTRWTQASTISRAQEFVFDQQQMPIGIRNVRKVPRSVPDTLERPGGYVNPNVANWYYKESFNIKLKRHSMCEEAPWLFGPEGLYPDIYECPEYCDENDPLCICPK